MAKTPLRVVVTRKLPDAVERRMAELFDVVLRDTDARMTDRELAEAADRRHDSGGKAPLDRRAAPGDDAGVGGDQRLLEAIEVGGRHWSLSAESFTGFLQELCVGHEETAFELSEQSSSHHTPGPSRSGFSGLQPAPASEDFLFENSGRAAQSVQGVCP